MLNVYSVRRIELFEIHDHRWFPTFLRDQVTDALQALWDFSNSYEAIAPLLQKAGGHGDAGEVDVLHAGHVDLLR